MRIVHAVTVPITVRSFLLGQLSDLADHGHDVHLICSPGPDLALVDQRVTVHPVPMERDPRPGADVRALISLVLLLRGIRPDVTVVGTPKAGLLVGLAARLVGVPRRFYLLRGLRLEGSTGARRRLLAALEVLAVRSAHATVAVSPSLAAEVRRLPGVPNPRVTVVGHGSSNGVDTRRFTPPSPEDRDRSRAAVGAGPDDVVLGFVGRLREDKGLRELMAAWQELREIPRAKLVVVGDLEDAPSAAAAEVAESGLHITGFVQDSAPWYAALDVLVLPTYREGFPNVVLEAAACGLPAVTTNATGARDSVVDGVTGLVVPVGDARALASALRRLVDDGGLRQQLGRAARERVVDHFDQQTVWSAYRQIWTDGTPEAQERTRPGV